MHSRLTLQQGRACRSSTIVRVSCGTTSTSGFLNSQASWCELLWYRCLSFDVDLDIETAAPMCFARSMPFSRCRPRVDRFHADNHKSCYPCFRLTHYSDARSRTTNSSAPEQVNSRLTNLGKIMSFSTGVHATMLLERALVYWNRPKIAALNIQLGIARQSGEPSTGMFAIDASSVAGGSSSA